MAAYILVVVNSDHGFVSWKPIKDSYHGFVSWFGSEFVSWSRIKDSYHEFVSCILIMDSYHVGWKGSEGRAGRCGNVAGSVIPNVGGEP